MITITIDCGSSFIKGAVFRDGEMKTILKRSSPTIPKEKSIFDIQQIPSLVKMVREMVMELAGEEKEANLCISNEMHGFLLAYPDGEPYTDYISWQKEFGNILVDGKSSCQILKEDQSLQEDIRYSGMPLRAGLPSSNLFYLSRTGKLNTEKGNLYFYTLGTYLLKALSKKEFMEHPTNAAATGLYDLRTKNWNISYIEKIGAGNVVFLRVGQQAQEFDLDGIRVRAFPALGDQQAALLGAGFTKDTDLSFNLGTGAQVSRLVSQPDCSSEYQIRPYFYGKYLKTIPHIPSGRALNVYFRFVKSVLEQYGICIEEEKIWSGMLEAANNADDTELGIDLGFFENAVTPSTKGNILEIAEFSFTFETLMSSVFKQMACNFIGIANRMESDSSHVKRLIFSGGIARRLDAVRKEIMSHYPQTEAVIADNETLLGLYQYEEIVSHDKF